MNIFHKNVFLKRYVFYIFSLLFFFIRIVNNNFKNTGRLHQTMSVFTLFSE
ncbi:hypothetical protein MFUM_130005 [Methylacidiphilum fumariolicum SolV]|uniref:Uncharacterized protein n=2 Tax=Candidatus Methylacidiphilum fumarolicum TaxID=591154 RepID=I0JWC2_METFB|nr:conserved protein of unknown function [Candidatus Methylacidiphilum fumarolicum]CCG91541.1 hypothetical protein MFUM_130005 [Methylacidiphilum fumariolicum SolV]